MFIKNSDNSLVFIKSNYINVFPCGRRRSNLIDVDGKNSTTNDRYYVPFDPEARLNTEANNRKHSGLNGFKQSYLDHWKADGTLSLVVAGYLFSIKLTSNYITDAKLGDALEEYFANADSIYVNIKLANIKFFDGTSTVSEAATEILRDQVLNDEPATCLDFLIDGGDKEKSDSYYFSGLSLSSRDLSKENDYFKSLQLLVKDASGWHICNKSRLPNIDHGDTRDSVQIKGDLSIISASDDNPGNFTVENDLTVGRNIIASDIDADQLKQNGHLAALLDISPVTKENNIVRYQLKFTGAVETIVQN